MAHHDTFVVCILVKNVVVQIADTVCVDGMHYGLDEYLKTKKIAPFPFFYSSRVCLYGLEIRLMFGIENYWFGDCPACLLCIE